MFIRFLISNLYTQMETIVRWLKDRKYRFYYQSKTPAGNCNDVQFIE